MIDDPTLLRRYATERSEDAFAEFVRRHLPLVYSAAARRLGGDTHRAEDVAQVVFASVARNAHALSKHPVRTGWLYTATRNAAIDALRADKRRRVREEEAHRLQENSFDPGPAADWSRLRPALDAAMDELSSQDREAVLLRYFQARQFAEVGSALGLSEDAARKRVDRALEKLHSVLGRRKIASTSAALATLLATETISAVPASLAASITGAAMVTGGAAIATGGAAIGAATVVTVTKLQVGIAAAIVVAGGVGLATQQRTIFSLRETVDAARQQHAQLATENANLARAYADANTALAGQQTVDAANPSKQTTGTAAPAASAYSTKRAASSSTAPARNEQSTTPSRNEQPTKQRQPAPETPELQRQRAQFHHRYDPFLRENGYTTDQAERVFQALTLQAEARQDLQASVAASGIRGDAAGVENLRSKLYEPAVRELREVLGESGYKAFWEYDKTAYIRVAFVDPIVPAFASAGVPLSAEQTDLLLPIFAANKSSVRANPTDIGLTDSVNWDAIVAQASGILTPDQLKVLQAFADRRRQKRAP